MPLKIETIIIRIWKSGKSPNNGNRRLHGSFTENLIITYTVKITRCSLYLFFHSYRVWNQKFIFTTMIDNLSYNATADERFSG